MTTPVRRKLRLLRRGALYALAALLVLFAIGNGLGSQLLPMVERNPQKIADWLSERAQRKVAFDHVGTEWTRRGPLLRLRNLRIGDEAEPLRVGDAEILVAQYAGWLPGRSLTELRVRGLDLTLQRDAAGRWNVRGLPGQQQGGGDPFATLERLGELQVAGARLHVLAPELHVDVTLPRIDLRMRVDGSRIRGGARAWLRKDATPFAMALDFDRASGDGRIYAGTRLADFAEVAGSVQFAGIAPVSGRGRVQSWAELKDHRVIGVHAVTELVDVALRGVALPGQAAPTLALGRVDMDARWAGDSGQWQAAANRLRMGEGTGRQVLDGLAVAGGQRYGLRAQRVDATPLLGLLALSDRVSPGLRHWLHASAAGVVLENVDVAGTRGGGLRVDAKLRGLHFAPVGNSPGMRGVDAALQGDADGMRLQFDPRTTVAFDWPAGFGVVHDVNLDGEVLLWRDGAGWTVQTPGLAIVGQQLDVKARGGIGFPNDGTRPRLDLAADIGEAPVSLARQFWVHHLMSKTTVDWLNAALQGGRLRDVHAVVTGDLDDWPFRTDNGLAGAGKFRVDARIVDGLLKFQPDWPAAAGVDADIRFEADGFTIAGKGRMASVPITAFKAGIPHFGHAELSVDAQAAGNAKDFLAMLRQSPLHKDYGETLDNLQVAGPARADFHMLLPFHVETGAQMRMQGTVDLAGAAMRENRWKLAFDNVRGQARYDRGGFVADNLQVQYDGAPGVLSLRAGPHVRDAKQAFEAELQANAGIDDLLDQASNLAWLKPYMDGRSSWTVAVAIPRGAAQTAPPTRLQLRSNLVGTAIKLPEPVSKPASQALAAKVDVSLPMERGEVTVELGNLLSLRSRSTAQQTGVRVQLGGGMAEAPPASGLVVGGRVGRLDALDWIGVVSGERGNSSMPLRRIEVDAKQLRLLGSNFADAKLILAPAARGTAVQVQGPDIAGSLLVPEQDGATVAGRFERLHWRMPPKTAAAVPGQATSGNATAFDPASIPPMLFEVGELHIGDAALGSARFRSTPVAGGMRMDEFASRGTKQRLTASGSWLGRGDAARTQLRLNVGSDDIGALLAGLGLGGQVGGGKGKLGVEANWRGGPEAFDPNTMDANVALEARDGRLLEIEPGAGRVLGLFGIAQLPRRLTLDFSDIFDKGFTFDSIKGDVRLAQGVARTDNLAIKGPAADIFVRGSADLRTQRFDQTVDVLPKSGGLLTAVGAIAGGPIGAAVGAVANAVLDKPLQGLGAKTYRVTGPWSSPKVEVTTRSPAAQDKPAKEPPKG